MLSKEKCIQAINSWKETKKDFYKIKKIINPTEAFYFTLADCNWLKNNNNNSNFHAYAGVHNDKFILIIVPLDNDGREIDLDNYLTTSLIELKNEITLIEKEITTTVTKTTLSKKLEITKKQKEVDLPVSNEPAITERYSLKVIEKWKNECIDWFFFECTKSKGKNIFRFFSVPFTDLLIEDDKDGEVISLFGFTYSSIYQTQIPILVFVSVVDKTKTATIIRSNKNNAFTSTQDMSHPCPPMCKDETNFLLFKSK